MKFNNLLENVKKIIIILFINLCLIVYSKADDIRDRLQELNIVLEDGAPGATGWRKG